MKKKMKRNKGLFFILPWVIGLLWFQMYPFVMSLYYSFTNYTMLKEPKLIGLTNYVRLLTSDMEFWPSMKSA